MEVEAAVAEERLKEYEEMFKYRYTLSDAEYHTAVERAKNPVPPPRMPNWPPFTRGRRPRDRPWRQPPRRDYHQRARHHDNSRNMDYDKVLEGYSRSKRQRAQQSYHDIEEKSTTEDASTTVTMVTTDDSDGTVTSPPIATGGKEKPHKGQQQPQHMTSHFVPFSEAAIEMGLAENRVAPSDTDIKAILSYASVATETRKEVSRGTDKQQMVGGKQAKREGGEESDTMTSSHKHESKKSHKKHRSRAREEEPPVVMPNLHPQNLLPADLIEQDDDEGEAPSAAPVVQVSNTKLIIRPPKAPPSPQASPVADTTAPKKASKKKKKKDKTQHSLKLKLKVQEDSTHIVL